VCELNIYLLLARVREEHNWPMEEIEVTLKRNHGEAQKGQHAKIVTVNKNSRKCLVSLLNDSSMRVDVSFDNIEPVRPSKKDNVKIILGEYRGELGSLIGVDSHDGIVKLKSDGSGFKILSMSSVAKYTGTDNVE
jgi:transcription elongation factor SPT5